MNRFFVAFFGLAVVCLTFSCTENNRLVGSANLTSEIRDLRDFTEVTASSLIDVKVIQGSEFSVSVRANDNIIDRVITRSVGGTLELDLPGSNFRNVTVAVEVVMPTLTGFTLSGAGDGEIRDFSNLANLRLEISGAGDLKVLAAAVEELEAVVSGAGDVKAFGLTAKEATMNISGAGDVKLTVSDRLAGNVSGAGTLRYRGHPTLEVNVTGAGELINAN